MFEVRKRVAAARITPTVPAGLWRFGRPPAPTSPGVDQHGERHQDDRDDDQSLVPCLPSLTAFRPSPRRAVDGLDGNRRHRQHRLTWQRSDTPPRRYRCLLCVLRRTDAQTQSKKKTNNSLVLNLRRGISIPYPGEDGAGLLVTVLWRRRPHFFIVLVIMVRHRPDGRTEGTGRVGEARGDGISGRMRRPRCRTAGAGELARWMGSNGDIRVSFHVVQRSPRSKRLPGRNRR